MKEALVGKICLANYGNLRSWRVDDIVFDQSCDTYEFDINDQNVKREVEGEQPPPLPVKNISIASYFKEKYNLDVKVLRQPILVNVDRKTQKMAYLVPEFCIMTGIPEDFSEFQRREFQKQCSTTPDQRLGRIKELITHLQS